MKLKIDIPEDQVTKLDELSGQLNMDREQLIRKAITKFLLVQEARHLRRTLSGKLPRRFRSEDDLRDAVS